MIVELQILLFNLLYHKVVKNKTETKLFHCFCGQSIGSKQLPLNTKLNAEKKKGKKRGRKVYED